MFCHPAAALSLFATIVAVLGAGPSGVVISPAGGTTFQSGSGTGYITLNYQQVNQPGVFQTYAIDVSLNPINGNTNPGGVLGRGVYNSALSQSANIQAAWATESACGDYQLVITEHQIKGTIGAGDSLISFQSAAPSITVNCFGLP